MEKRWVVGPEQARQRLDLFLVSVDAGPSRAAVQRVIAAKGALVNGFPASAARRLLPGDEVSFTRPDPVEPTTEPEDIPLRVIYEDADLLVVDKPRGMVVHPAAGNPRGTLVNALLAHCRDLSSIGGVLRPGIVHRLDKDTTGLMVVAKNDHAHLGLMAQLRDRTMSRTYVALVHGAMPPSGRLEMPIGRHPSDRKRMAVVARGRAAVTFYRLLETLGPYSLLSLNLATGRTHQIRVHLAAIGHPVVGDRIYGRRHQTGEPAGQALHAARLAFVHPCTGAPMLFKAEPPPDFLAALAQARLLAGANPNAPLDL